jgi:hypothetical protein
MVYDNDGPIYSVLNGKPTCTTVWRGEYNDYYNPSDGYHWDDMESFITETEGSTWDYCYCANTQFGSPTPPNYSPDTVANWDPEAGYVFVRTVCPVGHQFD